PTEVEALVLRGAWEHEPQGLAEALVSHVLETRGPAGGGEQAVLVQRDGRQPRASEQGSGGVGRPDHRAQGLRREHHRVRSPFRRRRGIIADRPTTGNETKVGRPMGSGPRAAVSGRLGWLPPGGGAPPPPRGAARGGVLSSPV